MDDWSELIRSIASILWPILGFAVLWTFKAEIQKILGRLKAGKFLGQEIELEASLVDLNVKAEAAATETPQVTEQPGKSDGADEHGRRSDDLTQRIIEETSRDPKIALMLLSSELEREVRQLLVSTSNARDSRRLSLTANIRALANHGLLATHLAESIGSFWKVRNELVHGHQTNKDDILRAIDSGLTILRTIRVIPREVNTVYHPGVEVYALPDGRAVRPDIKAVILETTSPGEATKHLSVYPSTRTHFEKGKQVAWDWNPNLVIGESWYRHPDTGEVTYGWTESMEFVGRHLEDM